MPVSPHMPLQFALNPEGETTHPFMDNINIPNSSSEHHDKEHQALRFNIVLENKIQKRFFKGPTKMKTITKKIQILGISLNVDVLVQDHCSESFRDSEEDLIKVLRILLEKEDQQNKVDRVDPPRV